jgi:hypothetical protein
MHVESVKLDPRTSTPVILLQEEEGARRRLPIWIGVYEAQSIAMGMEKITSPRPNAHDLMRNLVEKIDGRVARVLITELKEGVYYALLEIEIDAIPGRATRLPWRSEREPRSTPRTRSSVREGFRQRGGRLWISIGAFSGKLRARSSCVLIKETSIFRKPSG